MPNTDFYQTLINSSLTNTVLDTTHYVRVLNDTTLELLPLLQSAFKVRETYWGKTVLIHILNNVENGLCSENCSYCAQSKNSQCDIDVYSMKSEEQILEEAKQAYANGAFRHCMVFSGRTASKARIQTLIGIIKKIKALYPMQICVSPGFIDEEDAFHLKQAGVNRLNHNLNTSESYYPNICTTHTFQERVNTIKAAKNQGLEVCSGLIVGLGESAQDLIDTALCFNRFNIDSIPINFFMPIPGVIQPVKQELTPEYCLRVLCLVRFLNPLAEIRAAAGRELHLRSQQALALYPANSLFMKGYLNSEGEGPLETLQMIKDAGFTIQSDKALDTLLDTLYNQPVLADFKKTR
ncbi:biotin synthase BioB [Thermoproteota archaeon]